MLASSVWKWYRHKPQKDAKMAGLYLPLAHPYFNQTTPFLFFIGSKLIPVSDNVQANDRNSGSRKLSNENSPVICLTPPPQAESTPSIDRLKCVLFTYNFFVNPNWEIRSNHMRLCFTVYLPYPIRLIIELYSIWKKEKTSSIYISSKLVKTFYQTKWSSLNGPFETKRKL